MFRIFIILIVSLFISSSSYCQVNPGALRGGWLNCEYTFDDIPYKTWNYLVTLNLYGGLNGRDQVLYIWDGATGTRVFNLDTIVFKPYGESRSNQFSTCPNTTSLNNRYNIIYKEFNVTLPINPNGYFLTMSFRGRDSGIVNILDPANTGILYSASIPGTIGGIDYHKNSGPYFELSDTITVCRNTHFAFQVKASDKNGDSLSYRFADAIDAAFDTTSPPLFPVQYIAPFSASEPMGNTVTINPVNGIVSGTAPDIAGLYNLAVYVDEWRNGILINTTRKESQIKVVSCPFTKPLLKPLFSSCKKYTYNFKTEPVCPDITSWFWDFGLPGSSTDTSSLATPAFTYPAVPGNYTLTLKVANNNGYSDSATAIVKIVDTITVQIKSDTGICKTDTIVLKPVSDGVNYLWRESGGGTTLNNYNIKNPRAIPIADSTTYFVTAQLDACVDSSKIKVYTSPYPKAKASADTVICFSGGVTISGTISGAIFNWSPASSLQQSYTLQPFASPSKTTAYILSVRDTFYCPKIVSDTVIVKVIPPFKIDAGKDKSVSLGYPFQLMASGDPSLLHYSWQPAGYLNNSKIYNPVATIISTSVNKIPFTVTATTGQGCSVSDEVLITVYNIGPDILVPAAFTPNNDGKNDVLKPILIGIPVLDYFSIYNRYGQIVYSSADIDAGWDGTLKGERQSPGTYVFIVKGKDHKGKIILKKGTVVLVR